MEILWLEKEELDDFFWDVGSSTTTVGAHMMLILLLLLFQSGLVKESSKELSVSISHTRWKEKWKVVASKVSALIFSSLQKKSTLGTLRSRFMMMVDDGRGIWGWLGFPAIAFAFVREQQRRRPSRSLGLLVSCWSEYKLPNNSS